MILYKYLHPDRVDVLARKMVRFTQPGDFNDPFEFRPYIESAAADEAVRDYVEANFDKLLDADYGGLSARRKRSRNGLLGSAPDRYR
jgi:hypothetical protein